MHIHDTDFANCLLGVPRAVFTVGATHRTGAIDNAVTQYLYDGKVAVMAETSWSYGHGFSMSFCAIFEDATLEMGYKDGSLRLLRAGQEPASVELPAAGGHEREIDYFLGCVKEGRDPERCTPFSTRETMRIALAEEASALAGGRLVEL
jgi:predicted dehydrogenase